MPLLHWVLDQVAINVFKIAVILKTWPKDNYFVYLEFRRALYRRFLNYSKLLKSQLWREPGSYNWEQRLKRQLCIMCSMK